MRITGQCVQRALSFSAGLPGLPGDSYGFGIWLSSVLANDEHS